MRIKIPARKNSRQDDMRTWYLANESLGYCRYMYVLSNMIQGRETNWTRRLCTECSSTAQQVRPTKIQTTNLYITAPPFRLWLLRQAGGINDNSLEFTAAGRHHGDLTTVIQALLSLHMLIPLTDTNRYVTTGATVRRQQSFVCLLTQTSNQVGYTSTCNIIFERNPYLCPVAYL